MNKNDKNIEEINILEMKKEYRNTITDLQRVINNIELEYKEFKK